MHNLLKKNEKFANDESFKNSLTKCFIQKGLVRDSAIDNNFWSYVSRKSGSIKLEVVHELLSEEDSIAGWCIEMEKRPKDDAIVHEDDVDNDDEDEDNSVDDKESFQIMHTVGNISQQAYDINIINDNNILPNKRIRRPNLFMSEISESVYSDAQHRWAKK